MRRLNAAALLAALCLTPSVAHAQAKKAESQAKQKVADILTEFNGEMRGYERELKYFQRVPDAKPLLDLRKDLVSQAAEMQELDAAGRSGPAILKLAKEMNKTARKLDAETGVLEKRADAVAKEKDRAVAERMKGHSVSMVKTIDKVITMFR